MGRNDSASHEGTKGMQPAFRVARMVETKRSVPPFCETGGRICLLGTSLAYSCLISMTLVTMKSSSTSKLLGVGIP
ncbi:MAG: hypothetical protein ACI87O_000190 [Planctomycetota bacterium]|jgi:hypothetical protein